MCYTVFRTFHIFLYRLSWFSLSCKISIPSNFWCLYLTSRPWIYISYNASIQNNDRSSIIM